MWMYKNVCGDWASCDATVAAGIATEWNGKYAMLPGFVAYGLKLASESWKHKPNVKYYVGIHPLFSVYSTLGQGGNAPAFPLVSAWKAFEYANGTSVTVQL